MSKTYTPSAMRERAAEANRRIEERLVSLWRPTPFVRIDGTRLVCATYARWQEENARYERESGGCTIPAVWPILKGGRNG